MNTKDRQRKRIILIDDDPFFGSIMKQVAAQRGVELSHFLSLADLGFVSLLGQYDVAILDYDLGNMTGVEIGEYLTAFFGDLPMLLISSTMRRARKCDLADGRAQPFVDKKRGYDAVMSAALALIGNRSSGRGSLSHLLELGTG